MNKLKLGDTIGIISPSHIAEADRYEKIIQSIISKGFKVKTGENLYKKTYGYLASETERADVLNKMVLDSDIKMVFFGGGFGAVDLLPLIDYEAIKRNPKIFLSYSDGTSILNSIYAKTGILTYYGQMPGEFANLRYYDYEQLKSHFLSGDIVNLVSNSNWQTLHPGVCDGILIGGYTLNFALLTNSEYIAVDPEQQYVLFLEDHERFTPVSGVSMLLSHIEQSNFMKNVSGLLFGHYSENLNTELLSRLERIGNKHNIPVAYCDDFGHGANHAILPIGQYVKLDTIEQNLKFMQN